MLILLPPSEGKTTPGSGAPLDLSNLSFPELDAAREAAIAALMAVSAAPDALKTLKAGPSLAEVVAANISLRTAPTAPAWQVYSGVLYAALNMAAMTPQARAVAQDCLVISSAMYGVVKPQDPIASYRCSMGVKLPGLGSLASWWKPTLVRVLNEFSTDRIVLDCRSGPYAASWPLQGDVQARSAAVRVFREANGKRTVVSHNAKHARGLVAGHLVRAVAAGHPTPTTLTAAFELIAQEFDAEFVPAKGQSAASIDIIEREN